MKRLEQILLAQTARPGSVERMVQDALKLPAQNHAATNGDEYAGAVERFAMDDAFEPLLEEAFDEHFSWLSNGAAVDEVVDGISRFVFRLPLGSFWLDWKTNGFFASPGRVLAFNLIKGRKVAATFPMHLEETPAGWRIVLPPDDLERMRRDAPYDAMAWVSMAVRFALLCTMLSQHNIRTVRRVAPARASAAARRAFRVSMQRGRPWFSHNVVTMKAGDTSIHRGEVSAGCLGVGRRAHRSIGHWRLIIPASGEPAYFTWVMDSERGDPALGRVSKTRVVKASAGSLRRKGFPVPGFAGEKGMRVDAASGDIISQAPAQSAMGPAGRLSGWF